MKKAVLKLRKNSGAHIAAAVLGGVAVFLLLLNIVSVDGTTQSIFLVGFRRFLYFMENGWVFSGVCRDRFVGVAAALFNFADCGPNFGEEILPRLRCTLRNFSRLLHLENIVRLPLVGGSGRFSPVVFYRRRAGPAPFADGAGRRENKNRGDRRILGFARLFHSADFGRRSALCPLSGQREI